MAEHSTIEWTHHTWSPWIGCQKVSPACDGCYAEHLMDTRMGRVEWGPHGERKRTSAAYWRQPIAWNRAAAAAGRVERVFPSLCDPFDNQVDTVWRRDFFDLIRATPNLQWLLLTKRPQNAVPMCEEAGGLPENAALGTSVEDQKRAINLFHLAVAARALRARLTFASFEPLLGSVDPTRIVLHEGAAEFPGNPEIETARILFNALTGARSVDLPPLGWAITGGETSQGKHTARPSHPDWFRRMRDQCAEAQVPFLFKQWGDWAPGECVTRQSGTVEAAWYDGPSWTIDTESLSRTDGHVDDEPDVYRIGKKAAGRLLDGIEHNDFPDLGRVSAEGSRRG